MPLQQACSVLGGYYNAALGLPVVPLLITTHARRSVFRQIGQSVRRIAHVYPRLVTDRVPECESAGNLSAHSRSEMFDRRATGVIPPAPGQKLQVKTQHLVFSVVGDRADLVRCRRAG
jgi:hypothetical protein